ncbi:unnamed protein product [Angiostrongylus costaricensis]|uniref:DNA-directed DNA polymerase n=1 Tax=Angiostrongylus costaricensis TaxID=334426 RepID=A0A0R3PBM8_ANGCS|nr:unnamed protein product [Angiostrongylus costaricensis]
MGRWMRVPRKSADGTFTSHNQHSKVAPQVRLIDYELYRYIRGAVMDIMHDPGAALAIIAFCNLYKYKVLKSTAMTA